jgi:hypothetical protein
MLEPILRHLQCICRYDSIALGGEKAWTVGSIYAFWSLQVFD